MYFNKESLIELGELITEQAMEMAVVEKRTDSESDHVFELPGGDLPLHIHYRYHKDDKGLSMVLSYKGRTIANVQVTDKSIFGDAWSRTQVMDWKASATNYIIRQFSKWGTSFFMTNDPAMAMVRIRLTKGDVTEWSIGSYSFSAQYTKAKAGIYVYDRLELIYSNVKNNMIGVTTDMGFQGLSLANIISEAERVTATLVSTGRAMIIVDLSD